MIGSVPATVGPRAGEVARPDTQVLNRALNTHNFRKDVAETGAGRDKNPSNILGKAQDSLYSSKTGLRLFRGSSQHDIGALAPDEPETVDLHEPSWTLLRSNGSGSAVAAAALAMGGSGTGASAGSGGSGSGNNPSGLAMSAADIAASVRVGKVRRSSMTTYTFNLGGAGGGQVEREVRRLAGLTAFARPVNADVAPAHATSFDMVEEMTSAPRDASNMGDERDYGAGGSYPDGGGGGGGRGQAFAFTANGGGGGAAAARMSVTGSGGGGARQAFGSTNGGSSPLLEFVSSSGGGGVRRSITGGGAAASAELWDLGQLDGSGASNSSGQHPSMELRTQRLSRLPSSTQLSFTTGGGGGGVSPTASATVTLPMTSASASQLGLMRDRKGGFGGGFGSPSRMGTTDGGGGGGGMGSPAAAGAGYGSGIPGASGGSASSLPKLPTLPLASLPVRASSSNVMLSATAATNSPLSPLGQFTGTAAGSDSRPNSGRLVLPPSTETRTSLEPAAASGGGGGDGGTGIYIGGGGGGMSVGGRWFQQDAEDLDDMLYGNGGGGGADDMLVLSKAMAAVSTAGGGGGVLSRGVTADEDGFTDADAATGGGSGEIFSLPRLTEMLPDKAAATLQELRRFQATLDDHVARERQAMAAGRVRRSSVLEDAVGAHQPRWQMAYNSDVSLHGKLSLVDLRRSEMERPHLGTRLNKDPAKAAAAAAAAAAGPAVAGSGGSASNAGGGPAVIPAAAVSPVVARARRLSTVTVA